MNRFGKRIVITDDFFEQLVKGAEHEKTNYVEKYEAFEKGSCHKCNGSFEKVDEYEKDLNGCWAETVEVHECISCGEIIEIRQ